MKKTFNLENIVDKNDTVKKITAGNNHVLVLFSSGKLGVIGDNTNGQLGLPFKKGESENKINEIFVYLPKIEDEKFKKYEIIDIACGENFSLLLISANYKNYLFKLGYSQEDRYRDDIDLINPIVNINKIFLSFIKLIFLIVKSEKSYNKIFVNNFVILNKSTFYYKINSLYKFKEFLFLIIKKIKNYIFNFSH